MTDHPASEAAQRPPLDNGAAGRMIAEQTQSEATQMNSVYAPRPRHKCPRCASNAPHLHPAVQYGGEVFTCPDAYYLIPTNQNRSNYIADVVAERARRGMS